MDKYIISVYGAEKLDRVKTNLKNGTEESERRFVKKYPYANLNRFEFQVNLNKGGDIDKYIVYYKIDDVSSYDITSEAFLSNKEWMKHLYWQKPWGVKGTVQTFTKNTTTTDSKVNHLKIYVTSDQFFEITLPELGISNSSSNDYKLNTYLAALYAAYVATYSCGISTEHFEYNSKTPEIVTSIARYHLYYHMRRFIRQPVGMSRYITAEMKSTIANNKPVVYEWSDKFHQGSQNVGYWVSKQPHGTVRNARSVMSRHGGQVGISYQKRGAATIKSLEDYKLFIATKSDGLTKLGELLFQQSVESYVYCVLGAQAKTRWPIVGRGAMSIQTQEVFRKLVADTIVQSDQTVAVTSMRKAIKDTNVVLDMAISPGVMLVPSDMIILTKMVSGYNNILTLAKSGMRFGKNDGVNYFDIITPAPAADTGSVENNIVAERGRGAQRRGSGQPVRGRGRGPAEPENRLELYLLVISLIGGSLVSRFII